MLKTYKLLAIFALLFVGYNGFSQGHKIQVQLDGLSDTTIMLGYHLGEQKYVIDSAELDSKGHAIFQGDEKLDKGIYLIVLPVENSQYFEILIDDDQEFKVSTSMENYLEFMKVKGSKANSDFIKYQRKISSVGREMQETRALIDSLPEGSDSVEIYRASLKEQGKQHKVIMDEFIETHPDAMFTKVLMMMKDVEIPELSKMDEATMTDSAKQIYKYHYAREHYFDNFDFSESGIVKTPIFIPKIDNYMKQMILPFADSIIPEVNKIITRSLDNEYIYRHVLSHFVMKYQTEQMMGKDKVFVNIAETWYLSGEAQWADTAYLDKLAEHVDKIKPTLMGNIAPDIDKVPTSHDEFTSLYSIDAEYTILAFWETDCGHCKKIIPKLHKLYVDSLQNDGVEVFAMYTQRDKEEWIEFINEKEIDSWINAYDPIGFTNFKIKYNIVSTPFIYILDKDKKIIGKHASVESIPSIIKFDRKRKQDVN